MERLPVDMRDRNWLTILSLVLSMNKHDNDQGDLANVPTCWISKGSQLEIPVERLVNIIILITTVVLNE